MTFAPRYIPYREAARIVAERCGLKEGRFNPLDAALSESLILPEVIVHERPGQWRQIKPGEWDRLEIIRDFAYANPHKGFSVVEGDDHVRVFMAEIDRLWPPATAHVTDLAVSPDDEDYTFVRMLIEAIEHFKSTGKSPSERTKKEVKQYFLDLRLPDGGQITEHMAEKLATFCRSPGAMKGGNPKSKKG